MDYTRPDALSPWANRPVIVRDQRDLDLLLACPVALGAHESIFFAGLKWDDDIQGVVPICNYVEDAMHQVIAARILPAPTHPLPRIGGRVETMEVGGRPSPACHYGVGTAVNVSWSHRSQDWSVRVEFDECTGGWQGFPVYATTAAPWRIHVIGGDTRPFSTLSPTRIKKLHAHFSELHRARPTAFSLGELRTGDDAPVSVVPLDLDEPYTGPAFYGREAPLAYFVDGPLWVMAPRDLDAFLACRRPLSEDFAITACPEDMAPSVTTGQWVREAIEAMVARRLVPAPPSSMPECGSRVETISLFNRQKSPDGYVTGRIDWTGWKAASGRWGVSVRFDEHVELRRGGRLVNAKSSLSMVRRVDGPDRLYSTMSVEEIREEFERARRDDRA